MDDGEESERERETRREPEIKCISAFFREGKNISIPRKQKMFI
jgi:hypothetical protein